MGAGMASRAIPARLENLRRRFERWRQKRKHARARIPEPLWDSIGHRKPSGWITIA